MLEWLICIFFKQRTAYEMRISDVSSDVCSSVLPLGQHFDTPKIGTQSDRAAGAIMQQPFARHDLRRIAQIGSRRHPCKRARLVAPQCKVMTHRLCRSEAKALQIVQSRSDP